MSALRIFLYCGVLLIVAITAVRAGGEELDNMKLEDIPDPPEMQCKAAVSMLTKRMLKGLATCNKQLKYKTAKEKAAKSACVMRCVAMHEGMLQSDGYYGEERMAKFVKKEVPPNLREKVVPIITGCFETHKIENQNDEFCKNYEPLFKCFLDKLPTFCQG